MNLATEVRSEDILIHGLKFIFTLFSIYKYLSLFIKQTIVYTVTDCCAATSVEAQEAAFKHTFGMFSVPSTSTVSIIDDSFYLFSIISLFHIYHKFN